jgi:hypothetical protein
VIGKGENGLEPVLSKVFSKTEIEEIFTFPSLFGKAFLDVSTIYKGQAADFMRAEFSSRRINDIQKKLSSVLSKSIQRF